jgi:hypothetical protein
LGALAVLLTIAATIALALYQFVPPEVVPAEAPKTEFSAERALAHLEVIAREPHPVGSPENARVRDYLIQGISATGLRPQVQKTTVFPSAPDDAEATTVENVLVRIEGTEPTSRAILVTAHYDSVVTGPGAGDNGMSVAAMLETLRAIHAGQPPRNELIFLFNDGEEPGMFGSTAFVEQHPWAKDVDVAFDFDRDAPTGAANLSWTTAHDGWLVSEIAAASAGIYAASWDNASQRQEYDNDLNALAAAGLSGAHFDSFSGQDRYHTMRDNFASADPRALQDVGDTMVALSRHFGDLPIGETKAEDEIFFTLFGGGILHYPLAWALPLGLLAGLGTLGVIAFGVWQGRLRMRGLAGALVVLTLGAVAAAGAAVLAGQLILASHPEAWVFGEADFYGQGYYMGALYAFTVALALALWSWIGRRLGAAYLAVAALIWLGALAVFYAIASPHGSFAVAWPALAGVLALGVFVGFPGDGSWRSWARGAALLVPALLTIGFLMPLLYSATLDGFEAGLADKGAFLVLLLGLLAPQLALIARAIRVRWLPAAATLLAALIGVGLIVAGNAASGYDASHPRPDTLFYSLNADTGEASWATLDPELDQWTKQFLSGDTQVRTVGELYGGDDPTKILTSPAPVAPLKPPELELLGQEEANGTIRTLRLHLSSPREAQRAILLPGPDVEILALGVNGKPLQEVDDEIFEHRTLPPEGVGLSVKVRASGPVRLTVIDRTNELPSIPGVILPTRPETVMPAPLPPQAAAFAGYPTLVSKSFAFGKREAS